MKKEREGQEQIVCVRGGPKVQSDRGVVVVGNGERVVEGQIKGRTNQPTSHRGCPGHDLE